MATSTIKKSISTFQVGDSITLAHRTQVGWLGWNGLRIVTAVNLPNDIVFPKDGTYSISLNFDQAICQPITSTYTAPKDLREHEHVLSFNPGNGSLSINFTSAPFSANNVFVLLDMAVTITRTA